MEKVWEVHGQGIIPCIRWRDMGERKAPGLPLVQPSFELEIIVSLNYLGQFLLITNLTHFFQCIYLFPLSTCFEQPSGHHQENRTVSIHHLVCVTVCRWLPSMPVPDRHTRQSPTQSDIYQMMYWYIISWWWALGCSKHVEKGNKYIEKSASGWLLTTIIPMCTVNEI